MTTTTTGPTLPLTLKRGDLKACLKILFSDKIEGGFSDDPKDAGGPTNHGLSLRAVLGKIKEGKLSTAMFLRLDKNRDGVIDIEDVRLWEQSDTEGFYNEFYWRKIQGFALPASIALLTFDSAVNEGPETAIQHLQKTLGVTVDFVVGPKTIAAADRLVSGSAVELHGEKDTLLDAIVDMTSRRLDRYRTLKEHDRFFRGWARRSVFISFMASDQPVWGE